MRPLAPIAIEEIRAAQRRIAGTAIRTPLVPLDVDDAPAKIYLKLENLQPIGSFKLRGGCNAIMQASDEELAHGVVTASAGNWAQGLAWNARRRGVSCHIVVPEHAPATKTEAIARLGARVIRVPFGQWWQAIVDHRFDGLAGRFVHPVSEPAVIAGNGTVGLEILEDLPEADAVVVPFGGGGLSCGIACAFRGLGRDIPVYGAEVETAAPLAASLAAGQATTVPHTPSFVDGIGGMSVLEEMWPLASAVLAGSIVTEVDAIADAVRLVALRNHVIAEGAGAASVAAALGGRAGAGKVVCVVSGGNIDADVLATILRGGTP